MLVDQKFKSKKKTHSVAVIKKTVKKKKHSLHKLSLKHCWDVPAAFVLSIAIVFAFLLDFRERFSDHSTLIALDKERTELMLPGFSASLVDTVSPSKDSAYLVSLFRAAEKKSVDEKVDYWSSLVEQDSEGFLNSLSRLSTISGDTSHELLVQKKLNSMSYIEMITALVKSKIPEDFTSYLRTIRYREGQMDVAHQNHFLEISWFPHNEKLSFIQDITNQLAQQHGLSAHLELKDVLQAKWLELLFKKQPSSREIASIHAADWSWPTSVKVPYIEISKLQEMSHAIPSGSLLSFVHKTDAEHPQLITHPGFIVQKEGQVLFRYASARGNVRASELHFYVHDFLQKQLFHEQSPLIGFNIHEISP